PYDGAAVALTTRQHEGAKLRLRSLTDFLHDPFGHGLRRRGWGAGVPAYEPILRSNFAPLAFDVLVLSQLLHDQPSRYFEENAVALDWPILDHGIVKHEIQTGLRSQRLDEIPRSRI